jgi:HEAT repeat protein
MSEKEASAVDRVQQDRAREILLVLGTAVSAARLFPSEHPTVGNFISDLHQRLTEYLGKYGKLELGIEEQSFTLDGKMVFHDPNPARSLPFFFFKDGMKGLGFYRGLQKTELEGLLEAVRVVSRLPLEEGDIVNVLWEKDFPNIRYFAPDDFLETKIGVGRPPLRPEVDVDRLNQGRVELTPEDLEEIRKGTLGLNRSKENERAMDDPALPEDIGRTLAGTDERETVEIEALLSANRQLSHKDEYLSLILEIIHLEDRPEQFPAIADVLEQYHQQAIHEGDFRRASKMLRALNEIKEVYANKNKLKSDLMDSIIALLSRKSNLVELRDSIDLGSISDSQGLFEYLRFFGPRSAGLVADVYERATSQDWRRRALDILKEIGKADLYELIGLVQESRPALSQEIIGLLNESDDKRIVTFLANIVSYKNTSVKLAAIRALGRIQNQAANKVLLGFLTDPNEEVRVYALDNMKKVADKQVLSHIFEAISEKGFAKKSEREKKALFGILGRSDSEEACSFLGEILTKVPFLPKPKHTERCLYSITALEQMRLSPSKDVLKEGAKRRHRKIRRACLKALQAKSEITITYTGRTVQ